MRYDGFVSSNLTSLDYFIGSAKLTLYASIQNTISQHKELLSTREKALDEARESLVREGGAVVG